MHRFTIYLYIYKKSPFQISGQPIKQTIYFYPSAFIFKCLDVVPIGYDHPRKQNTVAYDDVTYHHQALLHYLSFNDFDYLL